MMHPAGVDAGRDTFRMRRNATGSQLSPFLGALLIARRVINSATLKENSNYPNNAIVCSDGRRSFEFRCRYLLKEKRMRHGSLSLLIGCFLCANSLHAADVLIQNAHVYDGTGRPAFTADVRVHAGRITAVGPHLQPGEGEPVRDAHGLALAPGFIDMHTHAGDGLLKDLD